MKAVAKSKIDRRETQVYGLIDNVDAAASKVNSEETAVFGESVGGLLNSEAHILDTEIDDLTILDPVLADRAEKLRCAATASAVKAVGSVRKFRNDDEAASRCSTSSLILRTKMGVSSTAEDKSASSAQPPKSDAQRSKDASESLFTKKKPTTGKEHRKGEPSPSSEDNSSGPDEDDSLSSEDAD